MTIYFYDMKRGCIVARSQAIRYMQGSLVPDSMGLPPVILDEDTSDPDDEIGYYAPLTREGE